jgi:hypothetical protein
VDGGYEWGKLGLDGEYVSNNYGLWVYTLMAAVDGMIPIWTWYPQMAIGMGKMMINHGILGIFSDLGHMFGSYKTTNQSMYPAW